ncbi:MAG: cobalamin-dependent protein, partial [Desulfatitalea sp.]
MHEVTFHMRLHRVVAHARGEDRPSRDWLRRLGDVPATAMGALTELLAQQLPGRFSLTGTLDRRLLVAERDRSLSGWTFADLSGREHGTRSWPVWTDRQLSVLEPSTWLGDGLVTEHGVYRLQRPRVLLTALYHPEWFPLPRFPLGISDLARACRATLMGQVRLMDMQLGVTLADIETQVATWGPDIVGISVTFGQHDLLVELLDRLFTRPASPLVVAGGSLSARNEMLLLERYPQLLVARGAGEPTIADLVGYFHSDVELAGVRGLGYRGAARGGGLSLGRRHTATVANRDQLDIWPELDLLDDTFACQGVAQLELSRGCVSSCSFCPRSHKGTWAGTDASRLSWL